MPFDRRELGTIFLGGFVGTVARAELVQALPSRPGSWPWVIFVINLTGAFLLGYLTTHLRHRGSAWGYARPLLGTGFCGALTTFSTMQLELLRMLDHRHVALALAYGLGSAGLGVLAVALARNLSLRGRWSA